MPSCVNVEFMLYEKDESQIHDISFFDWLPVSSELPRFGSDRFPGSFLSLDFPNNNSIKVYKKEKLFFLEHTVVGV